MKKPEKRPITPEPVVERDDVRVAANRCPFCHDDVSVELGSDWVACARCLGRHHSACWEEGGSCSSCGCDAQLAQEARGEPERPRRDLRLPALLILVLTLALGVVVALKAKPIPEERPPRAVVEVKVEPVPVERPTRTVVEVEPEPVPTERPVRTVVEVVDHAAWAALREATQQAEGRLSRVSAGLDEIRHPSSFQENGPRVQELIQSAEGLTVDLATLRDQIAEERGLVEASVIKVKVLEELDRVEERFESLNRDLGAVRPISEALRLLRMELRELPTKYERTASLLDPHRDLIAAQSREFDRRIEGIDEKLTRAERLVMQVEIQVATRLRDEVTNDLRLADEHYEEVRRTVDEILRKALRRNR